MSVRRCFFGAPVIRTAAVSPSGELWVSLAVPHTSLSFTRRGTVLVTPGCYEFDATRRPE